MVKSQSGFSLIEMALVMGIAGLIIGGLLAAVTPILKQSRFASTENKMELIADRIASFAQIHNRVPCPGDPDRTPASGNPPFGYERDSGTDGSSINTTCEGADAEGIIPFMTLGLNEESVTDAWGNLITYRVSPAFALDPGSANVSAADYDTVHAACRFRFWVQQRGSVFVNHNDDKARFCCPPAGSTGDVFHPDTDIVLSNDIDGTGELIWTGVRTDDSDIYDNVNIPAEIDEMDFLNTPEGAQTDTLAFVMVSHGPDRFGAFTGNSSTNRRADVYGVTSNLELENADGDNAFVYRQFSGNAGANHFDDILLWRTQNHIYSEFGGDSCLKP